MRADHERAHPSFSFEFYPPKTDKATALLFSTLEELSALDPSFVSITYRADGSSRERTLEVVRKLQREIGVEAMAHLTCRGHSREDVERILEDLEDAGIRRLLALRGDPPPGPGPAASSSAYFRHAIDLVRFIRSRKCPFFVGGACYPEGHVDSCSLSVDLMYLKEKVDAGLDFLITQLFFDNAFYFDFVSRARSVGIEVPIIPGIMPVTDFEQVDRFARMCGATIPMRLLLELERRQNDPAAVAELGVAHATLQCRDLLVRGAPGIHFFTLNRSSATRMIVTALRGAPETSRPFPLLGSSRDEPELEARRDS